MSIVISVKIGYEAVVNSINFLENIMTRAFLDAKRKSKNKFEKSLLSNVS
jgi:DNA-binding protein YbaB